MRVCYIHPSTDDFSRYFQENVYGGGVKDIRVYNRGGSFLGMMGRFAKNSIPFLKRILLPEIGNFVQNITNDISTDTPPRESVKRNIKKSIRNIGSRVINSKGGRKRKCKRNSKTRGKTKNVGKNKKRKVVKKTQVKNKNKMCKPPRDIFDNGL